MLTKSCEGAYNSVLPSLAFHCCPFTKSSPNSSKPATILLIFQWLIRASAGGAKITASFTRTLNSVWSYVRAQVMSGVLASVTREFRINLMIRLIHSLKKNLYHFEVTKLQFEAITLCHFFFVFPGNYGFVLSDL